MLFSFQLVYSSITSINSAFILCIGIYTILVNYIFGHPTFWRQSIRIHEIVNNNIKSIRKISSSFTILNHLNCSLYQKKINDYSILLENLNDDMIIKIFGYLNPYEIIVIMKTSKKCFNICNYRKIWIDMLFNTLQQLINKQSKVLKNDEHMIKYYIDILDHLRLHSYFTNYDCNHIKEYFLIINKYIKQIIKQLLNNNRIIIIIHNNIYDVSEFINQHPGGDAIIKQYNGKDATIIFDNVIHSNYAIVLMKDMLIFPKEYYNKKILNI